jgi:hypothetical protein
LSTRTSLKRLSHMRNGELSFSHFASYIQLFKKEESSDHLDSVFLTNSTTLISRLPLVTLTSIWRNLLPPTLHTPSKLCNIWFARYNMVEELPMLLIENSWLATLPSGLTRTASNQITTSWPQ